MADSEKMGVNFLTLSELERKTLLLESDEGRALLAGRVLMAESSEIMEERLACEMIARNFEVPSGYTPLNGSERIICRAIADAIKARGLKKEGADGGFDEATAES